jgi:hypothetical protein
MTKFYVAAGTIETCSQFLVANRAKAKHPVGLWELPNGKIESGETSGQCLKRELIDHDEIRWLPIEELDSLKWVPAGIPIIEALQQQTKAKATAEFYSSNANSDNTFTNDVNHVCDRFLSTHQNQLQSPSAGKQPIHYLGCGSDKTVLLEAQTINSIFDVSSENLVNV